MSCGGDTPDDRSMLTEGLNTLNAQGALAQQSYDLFSTWSPQYAQVGANNYLQAVNTLYPQLAGYLNNTNDVYRQGLMSSVSNGSNVYDAIKNLNANQNAMMQELNSQAQYDLANARNLSAKDTYDVTQDVRLTAARDGLMMNNSADWKTMQGVENLKNEREQSAQNFASGVAGLNQNLYTNPSFGILTASSVLPEFASNAVDTSANLLSPDTYNPFMNDYAADLYNTNYNLAWNRYEADKNRIPGLVGAGLGMVGSIVGGIFGGPLGAKIGGIAGQKTGYGFSTIALNI